ncbi:hypothetical protein BESB_048190 [Besnoitia besnoiti]|uniref:E3 ubiquitin-protein ligase listerin n=1 Tax=Besnoitia besnoiti TaxID=94643 RepID=A0A2A9MLR4_BESBE|nr:hypothetical protein BESB_048190 [Besnoitia besnoiti]PFH36627.1 hypothetical protein BESB_048190 [Besnoitia besnoiti]
MAPKPSPSSSPAASRGKISGKELKHQLRGTAASSARAANLFFSSESSGGAPSLTGGGATQLAAIFAHFAQVATTTDPAAAEAAETRKAPRAAPSSGSPSSSGEAPSQHREETRRASAERRDSAAAYGRSGGGLGAQASAGARSAAPSPSGDGREQAQVDEIHRALVKLTKRDSVTRLKGLQELEHLLHAAASFPSASSGSSAAASRSASSASSAGASATEADNPFFQDVAEGILSQFVYVYGRLALWDAERRIRAGVNRCLALIAARARKVLAPHLRLLLPYWFAASHDEASDVALAAQQALELAFPSASASAASGLSAASSVASAAAGCFRGFVGRHARLVAALTHCREAIFAEYLQLLATDVRGLTALIYGDKGAQKKGAVADAKQDEEAEDRYDRTLRCVLLAFGHLARLLAATSLAKKEAPQEACMLGGWAKDFEPLFSVGAQTGLVRFLAPTAFRLSVRQAALASLHAIVKTFSQAGLPLPLPPQATTSLFASLGLTGGTGGKHDKALKTKEKRKAASAAAAACPAGAAAGEAADGAAHAASAPLSLAARAAYARDHEVFPLPLLPKSFYSAVFSALADRLLCASRMTAYWSESRAAAALSARGGGAPGDLEGEKVGAQRTHSAVADRGRKTSAAACEGGGGVAPQDGVAERSADGESDAAAVEKEVFDAHAKVVEQQVTLLLPKLLAAVRHGGYSASASFYDALLPLLAALPCEVLLHSQEGRAFVVSLLGDCALLQPLLGLPATARASGASGKAKRLALLPFACAVAGHTWLAAEGDRGKARPGAADGAQARETETPKAALEGVAGEGKLSQAADQSGDRRSTRPGQSRETKAGLSSDPASSPSQVVSVLPYPGARALLTSHYTTLLFLLQKRLLPLLPLQRTPSEATAASASSRHASASRPSAPPPSGADGEQPSLSGLDEDQKDLLRLAVARAVALPLCFLFFPSRRSAAAMPPLLLSRLRDQCVGGAAAAESESHADAHARRVSSDADEEFPVRWHDDGDRQAYRGALVPTLSWFTEEVFKRRLAGAEALVLSPLFACLAEHAQGLLTAAAAGSPSASLALHGSVARAMAEEESSACLVLGPEEKECLMRALALFSQTVLPLFAALREAARQGLTSASAAPAASPLSPRAAASPAAQVSLASFAADLRALQGRGLALLLRLLREILVAQCRRVSDPSPDEGDLAQPGASELRPARGVERGDDETLDLVYRDCARAVLAALWQSLESSCGADESGEARVGATRGECEPEGLGPLSLLLGDRAAHGIAEDGDGGVVHLLGFLVRACAEGMARAFSAPAHPGAAAGGSKLSPAERSLFSSLLAQWDVARLFVDDLLLPLFSRVQAQARGESRDAAPPLADSSAFACAWRGLVAVLLPPSPASGGRGVSCPEGDQSEGAPVSGSGTEASDLLPQLRSWQESFALGLLHRLWKGLRRPAGAAPSGHSPSAGESHHARAEACAGEEAALEKSLLASAQFALAAPAPWAQEGAGVSAVLAWSPTRSRLHQLVAQELLPDYVELLKETLVYASGGGTTEELDREQDAEAGAASNAVQGQALEAPMIRVKTEEAVLMLTGVCLRALHQLYVDQADVCQASQEKRGSSSSLVPQADSKKLSLYVEATARTRAELLGVLFPLVTEATVPVLLSRLPAPSPTSHSSLPPSAALTASVSVADASAVAALSEWAAGLLVFHLLQHRALETADGSSSQSLASRASSSAAELLAALAARLPAPAVEQLLSLLRAALAFPRASLSSPVFEPAPAARLLRDVGEAAAEGGAAEQAQADEPGRLLLRVSAATVHSWAICLAALGKALFVREAAPRLLAHAWESETSSRTHSMHHGLDVFALLLRLPAPGPAQLRSRSTPATGGCLAPPTPYSSDSQSAGASAQGASEMVSLFRDAKEAFQGAHQLALVHSCFLAFLDAWRALCAAPDSSPHASGEATDRALFLLSPELLKAEPGSSNSGRVAALLLLLFASARVSIEPDLAVSSFASRAATAVEASECSGASRSFSALPEMCFPRSFEFARRRERVESLLSIAMPALVTTVLREGPHNALPDPESLANALRYGADQAVQAPSSSPSSLFSALFWQLLLHCEAEGDYAGDEGEPVRASSATSPPASGTASAIGPCMLRAATNSALRVFLALSKISAEDSEASVERAAAGLQALRGAFEFLRWVFRASLATAKVRAAAQGGQAKESICAAENSAENASAAVPISYPSALAVQVAADALQDFLRALGSAAGEGTGGEEEDSRRALCVLLSEEAEKTQRVLLDLLRTHAARLPLHAPVDVVETRASSKNSGTLLREGALARVVASLVSALLTISSLGRELGEAARASGEHLPSSPPAECALSAAARERESQVLNLLQSLRSARRPLLPAIQKSLFVEEEKRAAQRDDPCETAGETLVSRDTRAAEALEDSWRRLEAVDAACGLRLVLRASAAAPPHSPLEGGQSVEVADSSERDFESERLSDEAFLREALRLANGVLEASNRCQRAARARQGSQTEAEPSAGCVSSSTTSSPGAASELRADAGRDSQAASVRSCTRDARLVPGRMGAVSHVLALAVNLLGNGAWRERNGLEVLHSQEAVATARLSKPVNRLLLLALAVRLAVLYDEAQRLHEPRGRAAASSASSAAASTALAVGKMSFGRCALTLSPYVFCSQFYDDSVCRVLRALCDSLDLSLPGLRGESDGAAADGDRGDTLAATTAVAARICGALLGCRRSPVQASLVRCLRRYPWFAYPVGETGVFPSFLSLFHRESADSSGSRAQRDGAVCKAAAATGQHDLCISRGDTFGDVFAYVAEADLCEYLCAGERTRGQGVPLSLQHGRHLLQRFELSLETSSQAEDAEDSDEGEARADANDPPSRVNDSDTPSGGRAGAARGGTSPASERERTAEGSPSAPFTIPLAREGDARPSLFGRLRGIWSSAEETEAQRTQREEGEAEEEREEARIMQEVLQAVEEARDSERTRARGQTPVAVPAQPSPASRRHACSFASVLPSLASGASLASSSPSLSPEEEGLAILGWLLQIFTGRVLAAQLIETFRDAAGALALASHSHVDKKTRSRLLGGSRRPPRSSFESSLLASGDEKAEAQLDDEEGREREELLEGVALGLRGWIIILPALLAVASGGMASDGARKGADDAPAQTCVAYLQHLFQTPPGQAALARRVLSRAQPPYASPSPSAALYDRLCTSAATSGSAPTCATCAACALLQDVAQMSLVQALIEFLCVTVLQLADEEAPRLSSDELLIIRSVLASSEDSSHNLSLSARPAAPLASGPESRRAVTPASVAEWLVPPGAELKPMKKCKKNARHAALSAEPSDALWFTRDWRVRVETEGRRDVGAATGTKAGASDAADQEEESSALQDLPLHGVVWDVANRSFLWLLASHVYYLLLQVNPEAVRRMWTRCRNGRTRRALEAFTETYVSPGLVLREVQAASQLANVFDLSLRLDARQRDLAVTYRDENGEISVTLNVIFSKNFPLQKIRPQLDLARIPGVPKSRSSRWLLAAFGAMNRSSLHAGLYVWAANLRHFFHGLEDCPICYSVVHPQHRSLPKKSCPTCKYKFHAECIYRWFRTARKTNCPLCQSPF